MAVSGSTDFSQSRDELIKDALSKLGAVGPDKTPSGAQLAHAARALNRVVKSIDPDGDFLWRVVERTATTTNGTGTFTPETDVIAIDEPMNYKRSGENGRSVIRAISRDDWMALSDRTQTGAPSLFYVSETLSGLTVSLWPVPDATGDTVTYNAVLRSQDFDTGANTQDFPPEWTGCLIYGLAADLAPDYKQAALGQQLRGWFLDEKNRLLNAGTEQGNVILVPFGSMGGY